jgi:hypothetical protein
LKSAKPQRGLPGTLEEVTVADDDKVYSTDELMARMELDELEGATKLSPRDYGKMRGIKPQLVYYHIREGHVKMEKCLCGRNVIDVDLADQYFKKGQHNEDA